MARPLLAPDLADWVRILAKKDGLLRRHCLHQGFCTEDLHHLLQVVGEHMQAHLGADARQRLGEEVRRAHSGFERSERMLDGLTA